MLELKDMYYVGYIIATITDTCKLRENWKDCPFSGYRNEFLRV